MTLACRTAALLAVVGLSAAVNGQANKPINNFADAMEAAKKSSKLILVSLENPK